MVFHYDYVCDALRRRTKKVTCFLFRIFLTGFNASVFNGAMQYAAFAHIESTGATSFCDLMIFECDVYCSRYLYPSSI